MGGGVGVAHLLGVSSGTGELALSRPVAILLSALFGVALLLSLAHLGKPLRGALAVRGVGRSPLSREVVAVGAALAGGLLAAFWPGGAPGANAVGGLTALACLAALLSIGLVYRLPHQLRWRGAAVFQPLAQGALWGWMALFGVRWFLEGPFREGVFVPLGALSLLLSADATLFLVRFRGLWSEARGLGAAHPGLFRRRRWLLASRFALGDLLPAAVLLGGAATWGLLSITGAIVLDRLAFYGLALPRTTEAEVARVEARLSGS